MRLASLFLMFFSLVFLSGCVTTSKYKTDMERLQTRIDELQAELKQQEGDKLAFKEVQQQLEAQIKKQQQDSDAIREDIEKAKKKLISLNAKKSQEKKELVMPSASDIQTALKNAGFYSGNVDGVIGPGTKEAIKKFQEANQLTSDGVVGSKTWVLLSKYLEGK